MKSALLTVLLAGLILLTVLPGCEREEETSPDSGVVEANQAYVANFGPPPYETKGRAFARVGYLPLRQSPERVRPLPLFLFSEEDQLRQIFARLTGDALVLPPESDLYDPFPDDIKLTIPSLESGVLTVLLETQTSWLPANLNAAVAALTETAVQFPDVTRVVFQLNGEPLAAMPGGGFQHDQRRLAEVGPPTLVTLVGMWDKDAADLDEIFVEFDRPVTVEQFQLYDPAGKPVAGEYYSSAFQMAVVIHPERPDQFPEGTVLRAAWEVVDHKDRSGKGTATLALRRVEH